MKVTILGCGGAAGVPTISHGWGECDPANPRNRRLRSSILVEEGETRILVDTTPDLREQLIGAGVRALDAVIYTHAHADHLHGLDDLREVNRAMRAPLPVWGMAETLDVAKLRFSYAFEPVTEENTYYFRPVLDAHVVEGPFRIGGIEVIPFEQDHGYGRTLGLRFGPIAYSTDVVDLPEEAFTALEGIDTWIIGCLVATPHPTHAHVDKALEWIARIRPKRAYITHMGSRLDYEAVRRAVPPHVMPAHDGLVIEHGG